MLDLAGRRALVMGVANDRSIAWGIAQALAQAGAELALSFLPDPRQRAERRVRALAEQIGCSRLFPCDVREEESLQALFAAVQEQWGGLEVLVHCLAWANVQEMSADFLDTSRTGYLAAQEVSAYSLLAACRAARPLLTAGRASVLTVTYLGSQRAVPHYGVMGVAKAALESAVRYLAAELGPAGIRVNAVSPGPVETLAASAIPGLDGLLSTHAQQAPLRQNTTPEQVGGAAAFLCSDLAAGVTGQVIYVDGGFHLVIPA